VKKLLLWLGVFATVVVVCKAGLSHLFTVGEADAAKQRVRKLLSAVQSGGDGSPAICLWWAGSTTLPMNEFSRAAEAFDKWWAASNLKKPIRQFTIDDVKVISETEKLTEGVVDVGGTIDGHGFKWRCVQGQPIDWAP
jgi:hypothetical protein